MDSLIFFPILIKKPGSPEFWRLFCIWKPKFTFLFFTKSWHWTFLPRMLYKHLLTLSFTPPTVLKIHLCVICAILVWPVRTKNSSFAVVQSQINSEWHDDVLRLTDYLHLSLISQSLSSLLRTFSDIPCCSFQMRSCLWDNRRHLKYLGASMRII